MKRRIISAALALCMVLSLLPINVWAADDDTRLVTTVKELAEALTPTGDDDALTVEGTTVTLLKDITVSEALQINIADADGVTIDLGGHTLTGCIRVTGGKAKITNGTVNGSDIGLYLEGTADTTVTDSTITGSQGIVICSGKLTIEGKSLITGTGVTASKPDGSLDSDGSAVVIWNRSVLGGQSERAEITIGGEASLSSESEKGYSIREITQAGWEGTPAAITIHSRASLTAKVLKSPVCADHAEIVAPSGDMKAQTVQVKDGGDYGGTVECVNGGNSAYTLSVNGGKLLGSEPAENSYLVPVVYAVPEGVDDVAGALVRDSWDNGDFKDEALNKDGSGVEHKIVVFNANPGAVGLGERVTIMWLDKGGTVLAVTEATVEVEVFCTVTFDSQNGEEKQEVTVPLGEAMEEPTEEPTKDDASFRGWFTDPVKDETQWDFSSPVKRDMTLYAQWEANPVVTFDKNYEGAEKPETKTTNAAGTLPSLPANPSRVGYAFVGWYDAETGGNRIKANDTKFEKDTTVYAHWTKSYEITFYPVDGELKGENPQYTDAKGNIKELPTVTRNHYFFLGWFVEESDIQVKDTGYEFTEDTKVYAQWQKSYKVTFNGNGSNPKELDRWSNEKGMVTAPNDPTLSEHIFLGWYTDPKEGERWDATKPVTADITVYAHWKRSYKITFLGNGGTPTTQYRQTGVDCTISSLPTVSRSNYTFLGWFTAESGGEKRDSGYVYADDTTVYAQWEKKEGGDKPDPGGDDNNPGGEDEDKNPGGDTPGGNPAPGNPAPAPAPQTFTITFNANGGVGGGTLTTGANGRLTSMPSDPTRAGYTFDGWYDAASGGTLVTISTVFSANTTVYAHWRQGGSSGVLPNGYYQIYTSGSVYGGSYYVSQNYATPGTMITITLSPANGYMLGLLTAARADTGLGLYLSGSGNRYTFIMPDSDVRLTISFTVGSGIGNGYPVTPANARPVDWYYSNGNIYKVNSGLLPTNGAITRDMLVSILYNMDSTSFGGPTAWAASNDIVPDIIMSELWGADRAITREQAAMILYCYAQYKGYDTSRSSNLSGYTDYSQVRAIARPAVAWCHAAGLITGTTATTLSPRTLLTCGQMSAILSRFISNVSWTR